VGALDASRRLVLEDPDPLTLRLEEEGSWLKATTMAMGTTSGASNAPCRRLI